VAHEDKEEVALIVSIRDDLHRRRTASLLMGLYVLVDPVLGVI
jgi:hypothetical protein